MIRVCALALLLFVLLGGRAVAAAAPLPNGGLDGSEDFVQLAWGGFQHAVDGPHREGSPGNQYSWSGAWYRGKLYIGTGRSLSCLYTRRGFPGCPPNGLPAPEDRAEIWAYTPGGTGGIAGTWERVYQSPLLTLPTGSRLPRDVGYRGMMVCAAGGPPRLWVGAIGTGGRILGSRDGKTFSEASSIGLHNSLAELFAGTADLGFRALLCWNGRLLAAPVGAPGDGDLAVNPVVVANADPADPTSRWDTVVNAQTEPGIGDPNNAGIFSMTASNAAVYIGVTNQVTGFEIWKGTGCAAPPAPCIFSWKRIVENGGGRPHVPFTKVDNAGVTDAAVLRDRVYFGVSSSGFFNPGTAELVRVNPDDTWDLIMGVPRPRSVMPASFNCRPDPDDAARCVPLSGMGAGFGEGAGYRSGDALYVWRLTAFNGYLYAGLVSDSTPLTRSRNGRNWQHVSSPIFVDQGVGAIRTLVAAPSWPGGPALAFGTVGSVRPDGGLQVWAGTCAPTSAPVAVASAELPDAGASLPGVKLAVVDDTGTATVTLDGSTSTDPFCGHVTAYEWYEGDLVGRSLAGKTPLARAATASITLAADGDFSDHAFTLRVVDDQGNEDRSAVTVRATRNAPPTVRIETEPAPSLSRGRMRVNLLDFNGDDLERFVLRGSCDDPEGEPVSCVWSATGAVSISNPKTPITTGSIALGLERSGEATLVATDDRGYQTAVEVAIRIDRPDHDVAVEAIAHGPATVGLPQIVTVTMRNDGHFEETMSVHLADRTGGTVGPASRTITLSPGAAGGVSFTWVPDEAGLHTLTVTAEPVAGERIVKDNERSLLVEVRPPP